MKNLHGVKISHWTEHKWGHCPVSAEHWSNYKGTSHMQMFTNKIRRTLDVGLVESYIENGSGVWTGWYRWILESRNLYCQSENGSGVWTEW